MKRFLATAAIALSMTTAAQAANNTIMFAKGYWRVTHMARNSDRNPMCIMGRQISLGNSAGSVSIKWAMGHLFIEFSKSNWRFSSDKQVPFSVIFDKSRHEFYGTSRGRYYL